LALVSDVVCDVDAANLCTGVVALVAEILSWIWRVMKRLALNTIDDLKPDVRRPGYDVRALKIGIVHIGVGAFHRAHQAAYTDAAIAARGGDWGICGVSLKSPNVREQLLPQDGLYSVREVSSDADRWRVIGAVREVLFAGDQLPKIIARIAQAETHIVSLTVTEKGYCSDIAKREPLWAHSDVAHDIERIDQPISALGVLVAGLYERFRKRGAPLTVICCDNLPENGHVLESIVHKFTERVHPQILPWLRDNVTFPCSMVDRIVPATKPEDIAESAISLGVADHGVVRAEPFSQWVIEDKFVAPRPAWREVGVQFVSDVRPFEKMKLRLLNGSHSLIAYCGAMMGIDTIAEAIRQPAIANAVVKLMEECETTLDPVPGINLAHYRKQLIERFSNPAIGHGTWQVAMDGSQKLPQRVIAVALERHTRGLESPMCAAAVAAWIVYLSGCAPSGKTHDINDARAATFSQWWLNAAGNYSKFTETILDDKQVFGELSAVDSFRSEVIRKVNVMTSQGLAAAL
jgi:fructuronate reductase